MTEEPAVEPAQARESWTAGTSDETVIVYDVRYTNLGRRVRADSTAALELPHTNPIDMTPEDDEESDAAQESSGGSKRVGTPHVPNNDSDGEQ